MVGDILVQTLRHARWIRTLGLGTEWSEIWNEAFAGEAPPA